MAEEGSDIIDRDYWLAWEYDCRNQTLDEGELEWYLKYAHELNGHILELGCGTGRLLIPIAEAGFVIDGVDISEGMINRLKAKIRNSYINIASIQIFRADMYDCIFPRQYSLIFAGYNTLQYLKSQVRIENLLRRIYEHLPDSGIFLAMTYHRARDWYIENKKRSFEKTPVIDPQTGFSASHRITEFLDNDGISVIRETTHILEAPGLTPDKWSERSAVPLLSSVDYHEMLRSIGFQVFSYTNYDEKNVANESKFACHVAKKM